MSAAGVGVTRVSENVLVASHFGSVGQDGLGCKLSAAKSLVCGVSVPFSSFSRYLLIGETPSTFVLWIPEER